MLFHASATVRLEGRVQVSFEADSLGEAGTKARLWAKAKMDEPVGDGMLWCADAAAAAAGCVEQKVVDLPQVEVEVESVWSEGGALVALCGRDRVKGCVE